MIVYKNLTLHKITLAETVEGVEIVEPIYDKSALIVNTEDICNEFDRILFPSINGLILTVDAGCVP